MNCSKFTPGIITMAKKELLEAGAAEGRDRLIKVLHDTQHHPGPSVPTVCIRKKSVLE